MVLVEENQEKAIIANHLGIVPVWSSFVGYWY